MKEKIKCSECEFCNSFRPYGNIRASFRCQHPDQHYILDYFQEHRMSKAPGFLDYGKAWSDEVPLKTSPAWCPKKKKQITNDLEPPSRTAPFYVSGSNL